MAKTDNQAAEKILQIKGKIHILKSKKKKLVYFFSREFDFSLMSFSFRNNKGYSLLETMTVIAVLAIVTSLLYGYSDQGWKLFYQSYGRGLSQIKAKLAVKVISEDLRDANKNRICTSNPSAYGVPFPNDAIQTSPYIYFTKPKTHPASGDVIGYDYVLYYFGKPKQTTEDLYTQRNRKKQKNEEKFFILKCIKFLDQSKSYTEDEEKKWPFFPPILELKKSTLRADKEYIEFIKKKYSDEGSDNTETASTEPTPEDQATIKEEEEEENLYIDPKILLKKDSRNIPISGNFSSTSLTDPFSNKEAKITFIDDYKNDKPITIKVQIQESPYLLGLMGAMSEFEVSVTPRN